ncbi:acyloxyacyl hydrolase [Desulfosarcina alkanivorans]|nr:acyloxyacyl hydrolase [Desulfosarcina alkanivorans]
MIFADGVRRSLYHRFFRLHAGPWALAVCLTMTGLAFGQSPSAGPVREIRAGVLAHDVDGLWSGESREEGPDFSMAVIFNRPLFNLLSATAYPSVGGSWNTRGDTSTVYGGVLLQWEPASAFSFSTGIGLALHDGERDTDSADRKSLGSRVLFRIPIEIGYAISRHHRIVLAFDHVSNADLASPNEGMDSLGLVYGYRF